jgi:integrase
VSRWWFEGRDHLGRVRRFAGFTDKAATRTLAEKTEKLIVCKLNKEPPDRDLSAWLETIPAKLRNRFILLGLLPKSKAVSGRLLSEHVADFESWLRTTKSMKYGCKRSEEYIRTTCSRIRRVFVDCGFVQWSDIDKETVERYLGKLDIGAKTYNYYRTAIMQYCEWMLETNRASHSPLARLSRIATDDNEHRRALTSNEVLSLLAATEKAPTRFGMTGHERAVLYLLAIESGLRVQELRSLTVCSFNFDNALVTVESGDCKNRKQARQLLKYKRAEQLKGFFTGKLPDVKAFNMPSRHRTAKMLRADLELAGIPNKDDAGREVLFHSLRHTLATNLDQTGASIAERAMIMRHSVKTNLTLATYTHVRPFDLRRAVEALPDYPWPSEQAETLAATGTDNQRPVLDSAAPLQRNLASNLAELGGKVCTKVDNSGQANKIRVNCKTTENAGGNAKNSVSVSVRNESSDMVGVAQMVRALDCGSSATEQKSSVLKQKQTLSKKTQNDLALYLAEIAQKDPDLAEIVKLWPGLPEHIKAAINALRAPFRKAHKGENP